MSRKKIIILIATIFLIICGIAGVLYSGQTGTETRLYFIIRQNSANRR